MMEDKDQFHNVKKPTEKKKEVLCEACKKEKRQWKCVACEMSICDSCKTAHQSFPVTQDHEIQPLGKKAAIKRFQKAIDQTQLNQYKGEIKARIAKAKQYQEYLSVMKKNVLKDIDVTIHQVKEQFERRLETNEIILIEGVERAVEGENKDNDHVLKELNSQLEKLLEMSNFGTEISKNSNTTKPTKALHAQCQSVISDVKQCLSKHNVALKMELTLNPSDEDIEQEAVLGELEVNHTDFIPELKLEQSSSAASTFGPSSSRMSATSMDYRGHHLTTSTPIQRNTKFLIVGRHIEDLVGRLSDKSLCYESSVKLPHSCVCLCVINHVVWCVGRDVHTLTVLTNTGDVSSKIAHPNMRYPTSVAQCKSSVIVACDEGYGLLEFTTDSMSFSHVLTRGSFSDVTCGQEQQLVYALECTSEKLMVFERRAGSKSIMWDCVRVEIIEYMKSSNQDTLLIHQDRIFVSASRNKCVFVLRKDGRLLNTMRLCDLKHQVYSPSWQIYRLCGVDTSGDLLLSNQTDGRVLILKEDGTSSVVQFNTGISASDVILGCENTVYILEDKLIRVFTY